MLSKIDAVIFDLDGLVLDTEITYFAAWRQAAGKLGYQLSNKFCQTLSGLHYQAIEQKLIDFLGPDFDLDSFNRLSGDCWHHYVHAQGIQIKQGFQGLLELLIRLELPYALATNSRLQNALECLDLAGLANVFPVIIARDHVNQGKPAPDIFWAAAGRMSVDISRCLVLEDSASGVIAATAAGAVSIFVPSTSPVDRDAAARCDRQCRDLDEVARLLSADLTNRS
ncbi:MAG: HAD family hydrolase [Gammaproteobacteria bacterium]